MNILVRCILSLVAVTFAIGATFASLSSSSSKIITVFTKGCSLLGKVGNCTLKNSGVLCTIGTKRAFAQHGVTL